MVSRVWWVLRVVDEVCALWAGCLGVLHQAIPSQMRSLQASVETGVLSSVCALLAC